jgi:glucosylceramidase
MTKLHVSIAGAWLAFFTAACSSSTPDSDSDSNLGAGGSMSNAGGAIGNSGGAMGSSGGATGNSGGSVGNSGGAVGNSGGAVGDSGGSSGTGGDLNIVQPDLVTSGVGAYFVEAPLVENPGAAASITVDVGTRHQTWMGFGGTFNEAGWDALAVLDPTERDRAIRLLFDMAAGAGFDWGRIPIGASDYAIDRYSLAETPDDFTMTNFSIERDREMLIPYIKAALSVKPDVRLWASPWSPPAWMKDNNNLDGLVNDVEANMKDDPQILEAYALYFARFVEEYAAEGLTIDHVQPQNEPGYATRYPSCLWSSNLMTTFVRDYLGPTLATRVPTTGIWLGTMSRDDSGNTDHSDVTAVMGDSSAASYIQGIGLQWNMMGYTSGYVSDYGVPVMQTEHKCGNYHWNPAGFPAFNPDQPPNDHAYGVESWGYLRDWIKAGVSIYNAWNMVLDTKGHNLDEVRPWPQNALLVVDRTTNTLIETAAYYAFRHFSQFVDVGATRVDVSSNDAVAFENPDGSIVTVLYNSGGSPANTALGVGGTTVEFTIPANGFATVNFQ